MKRIFTALAVALALAATLLPGRARAADGPAVFEVYDTPNDDGKSISVEWSKFPDETKDQQVAVLLSGKADGPWIEAVRRPADLNWKKDATAIFGISVKYAETHYVFLPPLNFFSSSKLGGAVLANEALGVTLFEMCRGSLPFLRDNEAQLKKMVASESELALDRAHFGEEVVTKARAILDGYKITEASQLAEIRRAGKELEKLVLNRPFYVKIELSAGEKTLATTAVKSAMPEENLFNWVMLGNAIGVLILGGCVMYYISRARKNTNLFLRRISGLDAVDEALGRATEMGKPVLFVHGLGTMSDLSTIAAVNILGEVSKKVATFDTKLVCANNDPIVFAVSQETMKEGFNSAGRPDAYNSDDVVFVAGEQFSYVAAVDGIMLRDRPAANFFCGYFYAESLLLSETGASTGAIQIAATDAYTQLPFFITTCDYTLMGEELYAASAYLSRDPMLVGSLKGQDVGKALILVFLLVATAFATASSLTHGSLPWLDSTASWIHDLVKAY